MAFANQLKFAADAPLVQTEPSRLSTHPASGMKRVIVGPNGLRAGWRLLLFVVLVVVMLGSFILISNGGLQGVREAQKQAAQITITPFLLGSNDAIAILVLCVATLIMGKLEHGKFSEYGLPLRQALRKDFWFGSLLGFLGLSGTLLIMFLLHGFRITGLALHGTILLSSLFAWSFAFLLVGVFEEFAFRGYVQYTLASGIGFWPGAFVISGLFALSHAINPGETVVGLIAVVMFGLLLCLFLRRTGNLWCAIGFHAAWDWGQMFYGVPDSGIVPYHNVLSSAFSGPRWLTGGTVGPEASVLTPIALLAVALVFSRYYREHRYQTLKPRSLAVPEPTR
jgi:membrane protease YdiL (CAAX protease family)